MISKKQRIKRGCLKVYAFFLSLLLSLSGLFSMEQNSETTEAASGTVKASLSAYDTSAYCPTLSTTATTLWHIYAGGNEVFCTNHHGSLHTGDTMKYTTIYATTFAKKSSKKKAIAKALVWYYSKSGKGKRNYALTQAYIWATNHGKSKTQCVKEMSQVVGGNALTTAGATKFCNTIANTEVCGTVYEYKCTKCPRGSSKSGHQVLYRWVNTNPKPEYGSVSDTPSVKLTKDLTIEITKTDESTGEPLEGATYDIYVGSTRIAKDIETDENGKVSFTYTFPKVKKTGSKITKKYVKNWNKLSTSQQKKALNSGYYSSKSKAKTALNKAMEEAEAKLKKSIKNSWSHKIKVVETSSPKNHTTTSSQTQTEEWSDETLSFNFSNTSQSFTLNVVKTASSSSSVVSALSSKLTLAGAEFKLYAAENILASDNKTVKYASGALVATITTNSSGKASVSGLIPGKYTLKETKAPTGYSLASAQTITLTPSNQTTAKFTYEATVKEEVTTAGIKIVKKKGTSDSDSTAEEGAKFTVSYIESNGSKTKVGTITTGSDGTGSLSGLLYGSYYIEQTEGADGYTMMSPVTVKLTESYKNGYLTYTALDKPDSAGLRITKTALIEDSETGIYDEEAEEGAVFELYDSKGTLVDTLTTDANGIASKEDLTAGETYMLKQISGKDGYTLSADQKVTISNGLKDIALTNKKVSPKVKITKTYSNEKETELPEEDAVFYVLDVSKLSATPTDDDLADADSRMSYISSNEDAIVGTLTTDENGEAALYLSDLDNDADFVVIQTSGKESYALADPFYSSNSTPTTDDNGNKVYSFTADDYLDEYGVISIHKTYTISDTEEKDEEGATFEVYCDGELVETIETDEDGNAETSKLPFGTYRIVQTSGVNTHDYMPDQTVTIDKSNKHKTIELGDGTVTNSEKLITFKLTKLSSETKITLGGAEFGIYDENGNLIKTLVTGSRKDEEDEDKGWTDPDATEETEEADTEEMTDEEYEANIGIATCELPYGTYTIKELSAPDGYNITKEEETFELTFSSVTYDDDGNGTYEMTWEDAPIMGEITVEKTGLILSDYDSGTQMFEYEEGYIAGAVYGLYAAEDIVNDAGEVIYAAGTLIDQKTTSASGSVYFTRIVNGEETTDMYLGEYYIQEITPADGYTLNTEKDYITLTYDDTPNSLTTVTEDNQIADIDYDDEEAGAKAPEASSGDYILCTGETLNPLIKDATSITFTYEEAPSDAELTDVSSNGSGTIVMWNDGTDYYISTKKANQVINFNVLSSHMFEDCTDLTTVNFENVDTSDVVDMSYMFANDVNIVDLDLSNFNTLKVRFYDYMFYGLSEINTITAIDQDLELEEEEEGTIMDIEIYPLNTFLVGDTYLAENFLFVAQIGYNIDGETIYATEEIEVDNAEVTISPATATKVGTETVSITFLENSEYYEFGTIDVEVEVLGLTDTASALITNKKGFYAATEHNDIQQTSIQLQKVDEDGESLGDAEFTIYANVDIYNEKGEVIVKAGTALWSCESGGDGFYGVDFTGLPTSRYTKTGTDTKMYYIQETRAPLGYELDDTKYYFTSDTTGLDVDHPEYVQTIIHVPSNTEIEVEEDAVDVALVVEDNAIIENHRQYLYIHKNWNMQEYQNVALPESLTITVTYPDGSTKDYELNEDNGWTAVTDITITDYTANSDSYSFVENLPDEYEKSDSTYVESRSAYVFGNIKRSTPDINVAVQKEWDDNNNSESIRPSSVEVQLYMDGESMGDAYKVTLDDDNDWYYKWEGLEEDHVYTIEETETDVITGDSKTGYSHDTCKYSTTLDEDGETTLYTITQINKHKTTKKNVGIVKVWDDNEDESGIRPDSIQVKLYANDDVYGTYTIDQVSEDDTTDATDEGHWIIDQDSDGNLRLSVLNLPEKDSDGNTIEYTWKEVTDEDSYITGEDLVGYEPSVSEETESESVGQYTVELTTLTNKHTPTYGQITITKSLLKDKLTAEMAPVTITFTLTGTDIYGVDHTYTQDVTFSAAEVEAALADEETELTKTVTFEDIVPGTYTSSESCDGVYIKQKTVTATSDNVTINESKSPVYTIYPYSITNEEDDYDDSESNLEATSTYENEAKVGSIKLVKKDDDGNVLEGVEFTLYDSEGNEVETKATDNTGVAEFTNLTVGTYTVKETKTVSGQQLLSEPFEVVIPLTMTSTEVLTTNADTSKATEGDDGLYYFYDLTYEVTNSVKLTMPTAGIKETLLRYLPLILGALIILIAVIYYIRKKRKK